MDCLCGCGKKVSRAAVDFNFQAGEVGLELMVWDKARVGLDPDSADTRTIERLIEPGAASYQRSLAILHGEIPPGSPEEGELWLERSREARREMSRTRPFVPKNRIKPTESDYERFNPLRPELSFSGRLRAPSEEDLVDDPAREEDPVAQLRGLRQLHEAGALTDAEFTAAKARVIARM